MGNCKTDKNKSGLKELLKIENLATGYEIAKNKRLFIHSGINATVKSGEFISILGLNGTGKSTLLKTIAGFNKKLDGKIYYDKSEIGDISIKELAKKVAVVLTSKPDDIYLTPENIIITGRYPYGSIFKNLKNEDFSFVHKAAKQTGVENLLERKFVTLSDGEKQRVMIARAIAQSTPLILLDEPAAFIDSPGKVELMLLLRKLSKNGKSVILTTHDVELALEYSDTLWILGKQNIFESGSPREILKNDVINKVFISKTVKFDNKEKRFKPV